MHPHVLNARHYRVFIVTGVCIHASWILGTTGCLLSLHQYYRFRELRMIWRTLQYYSRATVVNSTGGCVLIPRVSECDFVNLRDLWHFPTEGLSDSSNTWIDCSLGVTWNTLRLEAEESSDGYCKEQKFPPPKKNLRANESLAMSQVECGSSVPTWYHFTPRVQLLPRFRSCGSLGPRVGVIWGPPKAIR